MFKKIAIAGMLLFSCTAIFAHCQVPCGIFDDDLRLAAIQEDILTIEKSINEIVRLQAGKTIDYNQIVRWINNKDKHAETIQATVTDYFMAQRVRPVTDKNSPEYADYIKKLTLLHGILVAAMKSKQSLDLENVAKLRALSAELNPLFEHKH
ncbi:MAG: superoxide dismutase [Ni] [Victivallaceae bacterium]|jgi:nickel superoxide dismutase